MRPPTSTRADVPREAAGGPAPAAARAHHGAAAAQTDGASASRAPARTARAAAARTDGASASGAPARTACAAAQTDGASASRAPARIVAVRAGAATVLRELRAASPWAPRPLPRDADGGAFVALVQSAATLVSGDNCAIELELGAGAALTVVETGATIAHHVRGGAPARLAVRIRLAQGARLTWLARPLVLGGGCAVERATTIELAEGARALLRETVVLGRSGEQPGVLRSTLRATHAGRPLLHERLDTGGLAPPAAAPPAAAAPPLAAAPHAAAAPDAAAPPLAGLDLLRSPLVAGAHATTLDAVLLLGARGADTPGSTQLAGPGSVWRALSPRGADPDGPALAVARAWAS